MHPRLKPSTRGADLQTRAWLVIIFDAVVEAGPPDQTGTWSAPRSDCEINARGRSWKEAAKWEKVVPGRASHLVPVSPQMSSMKSLAGEA